MLHEASHVACVAHDIIVLLPQQCSSLLCECAQAGTDSFQPMKHGFGATFEASRLPELPWDIKLTNTEGKSILLK